MIKNSLLIISLIFTPLLVSAHNIQDNQRVPPVGVRDKGELDYDKTTNQFNYKNWNSSQLPGKTRVIQHIAGRTSAKEMNAPLIDAIKQANLPRERYQTTTIVNTDDAIIGTAMFVRNSIESSKREFPWSQFIIDSKGNVAKSLGGNGEKLCHCGAGSTRKCQICKRWSTDISRGAAGHRPTAPTCAAITLK